MDDWEKSRRQRRFKLKNQHSRRDSGDGAPSGPKKKPRKKRRKKIDPRLWEDSDEFLSDYYEFENFEEF